MLNMLCLGLFLFTCFISEIVIMWLYRVCGVCWFGLVVLCGVWFFSWIL